MGKEDTGSTASEAKCLIYCNASFILGLLGAILLLIAYIWEFTKRTEVIVWLILTLTITSLILLLLAYVYSWLAWNRRSVSKLGKFRMWTGFICSRFGLPLSILNFLALSIAKTKFP